MAKKRDILTEAIMHSNLETVIDLIEHKRYNIDKVNKDGNTPLYTAVVYGDNLDIIMYLVEKGADKDKANKNGVTPLLCAVGEHIMEAVQYFVEMGSDIDKADKDGDTPVHSAVADGNMEIIMYLCEHGADINIADKDGNTPLHTAARLGQVDVVRYLVDHGANDTVNNDDDIPLDIAGNNDVKKILTKNSQTKLAELYDNHALTEENRLQLLCNGETACPVTMESFESLHHRKRVVVMADTEGHSHCYSFYAFVANENSILELDPFTRNGWSADALDKIETIRMYKNLLQNEYVKKYVNKRTTRRKGRTGRQRTIKNK